MSGEPEHERQRAAQGGLPVVEATPAGQADAAQQREGHNENEKRNHATHLSDVRTRDAAAAPTTMATSAGALIGAALQVNRY
jgi:hypothetical protein